MPDIPPSVVRLSELYNLDLRLVVENTKYVICITRVNGDLFRISSSSSLYSARRRAHAWLTIPANVEFLRSIISATPSVSNNQDGDALQRLKGVS